MTCCDNKSLGCRQGRDCEVHNEISQQRVERLNRWLLDNYLLVSNSWMFILVIVFIALWATK